DRHTPAILVFKAIADEVPRIAIIHTLKITVVRSRIETSRCLRMSGKRVSVFRSTRNPILPAFSIMVAAQERSSFDCTVQPPRQARVRNYVPHVMCFGPWRETLG